MQKWETETLHYGRIIYHRGKDKDDGLASQDVSGW